MLIKTTKRYYLTLVKTAIIKKPTNNKCWGGCHFISVQSLSCVQLFVTPWTAARPASVSITNSRSLLKLMSIESVMPSNHLILCHPLLLPSIFPSMRVFSNESALRIRWPKYWHFSFNISPSISSRSSGRSSKNHSTSAFQHYWSGIDLDYCDI